ncbi:CBO0543 family protein [Mesobacillus foraminis]|uniref:CBO0543 family protein n=1 Tax=Mesobacillus foraminis TaxID=279826 RepID=UPI0035D0BD38
MEIYATTVFALLFGVTTDVVLDLHYNMYGYFDKGFQWKKLLALFMYFPATNLLFLNSYPFHKSVLEKLLYVLLWTSISITFEWLSVQTYFFYYNGWKLWYSGLLYPFIFLILLINLKFIQRINNRSS